jgi:erythromycin esterase
MLDQLAWMRERNARSAEPVRFYGMDLPGSSATALPGILGCLPVLDRADPHYADVVRGTLLPLFDYLPTDRRGLAWAAPAIQSYLALAPQTRFELTARIAELVERMQAMRVQYAESTGDAEAVETALRCAVTARHADAFLAAMLNGPTRRYPPANIRDAAMAENLDWILQREDRIVVVAANGHVQKAPFLAPPFVTEGMSTLGEHLAARFGSQMVVIGCTYGGGEAWLHRPAPDSLPGHSVPFVEDVGASHAGSLDALLGAAGPGDLLIDLRRVPQAGKVAERFASTVSTMNGPHTQLVDPLVGFDAAYFVGKISPWHTWINAAGMTEEPK